MTSRRAVACLVARRTLVLKKLTVHDHDRNSAERTYVYPVVSRRARGVSIGINLNPDNTCNFRCIYCQVPGLVPGNGPAIDLALLERELRSQLQEVLLGDFMTQRVPEGSRRLNDVAFSGNGEPTTSPDFAPAVQTALAVMSEFGLLGSVKVVLITNGSRTDRAEVEPALEQLAKHGGEIWFKLDSVTQLGASQVNSSNAPIGARLARLERVTRVCPTWLQSCFFELDGQQPSSHEVESYLAFLADLGRRHVPLRGVLLYGIARKSHQPEAPRLSPVSGEWLRELAARIEDLGIAVEVSV